MTNSEGLQLYLFDRSRLDAAEHCPRLYYWNYMFLGLGIVKLRTLPTWDLMTGSAIHTGIESLLLGIEPMVAASEAAKEYRLLATSMIKEVTEGLMPDQVERLYWEMEQQLDLVMALVYGWSLVGLPRYNSLYSTLEEGIEHEEEIGFLLTLANGQQVEMRLMTRADIISSIRNGNGLILHNLKSVSSPNEQWRESWPLDQQTLTERIASEHRIGKEIVGVVMEGMVKGAKKEYPANSGYYQHGSPLIWAWADKLDQPIPGKQRGFYGRYEWFCEGPHLLGNGRKCPGGKEHRLSGVTKERVERVYPGGIFAWLDWLSVNDRGLLEQQFISLPPIGRSDYEVERWKRQVLMAEYHRQVNGQQVNELFIKGDKQAAYSLLDYTFPMYTAHGNCLNVYHRECSYKDICWGAGDPFDEQRWGPRTPNHAREKELVQIEVGIE